MKITVTAKHIKNGKPKKVSVCPIALSLKEQFPNKRICVEGYVIHIGNLSFSVSERARKFILKFDQKLPVKPFTFNLK